MIERIHDLPAGVVGLRARGTVTKADYEQVVMPLLETARREQRRLRLLYVFGPDFERFTLGAAMQDLRVGVQSLRLFERFALVTDLGWLSKTASALGSVLPFAVHVYRGSEFASALEWLAAPTEQLMSLQHAMVDTGALMVEPEQPIRAGDMGEVEAETEKKWVGTHGELPGVAAHAQALPGWDNLGAFLRHVQFVRAHHYDIKRMAVAADGQLAAVTPTLVDPLVSTEGDHFEHEGFADALAWAATSS